MTPEEKSLLEETVALSRENNRILHGMRRSARWSMMFTLLYWFVILGGIAVSFYYAQPYISMINKSYIEIQSQLNSIKGTTDKITDINSIFGGTKR